MGKINCLKDYWSTANLMSVILTMKVKGRNSKTTGNGCGKTRMDGEKIYLLSYTSYATKNREFCNLIFLINTA